MLVWRYEVGHFSFLPIFPSFMFFMTLIKISQSHPRFRQTVHNIYVHKCMFIMIINLTHIRAHIIKPFQFILRVLCSFVKVIIIPYQVIEIIARVHKRHFEKNRFRRHRRWPKNERPISAGNWYCCYEQMFIPAEDLIIRRESIEIIHYCNEWIDSEEAGC